MEVERTINGMLPNIKNERGIIMKLKKLLTMLLLGPLFPLIGIEGEEGKEDDEKQEDQQQDEEKDDEKQEKQEPPKTYTQDDINKIIEKRLNRERKTWKKQVEDERVKAQMTTEEKLKTEKAEAENKANEAIVKANQRLVKSEILNKAADLGVIDTDAAYRLLDKDDIEIDDDGNITGVEEAVKALITAKPYLIKKTSSDENNKSGDDQQGSNSKKKSVSLNDLIRKATGR